MALNKRCIIFGIIGCLCFGIGDWLLGYVDPAPIEGNIFYFIRAGHFCLRRIFSEGKTFLGRSALFFIPAVSEAVIMLGSMLIPPSPFSYGFYAFCINGGMLVWFGYLLAVNLKG